MSASMKLLVDIAAGMIVKSEETGASKYLTPASAATQLTGGTDFTFRADMRGAPTTMPN
jgi:hypothetical protein